MARYEPVKIEVSFTLTNEKAFKALAFAYYTLKDIHEDMPWREDAKKAMRALTYVKNNLGMDFDDAS